MPGHELLSAAEARRQIFDALGDWGEETVPVARAVGRTLAQTVRAERDQPPFDRVTMDGIAIAFEAIEGGRKSFTIAGTCHAGEPAATLADTSACIEIMTGAVLPAGADTVVAVERLDIEADQATLEKSYQPERGQFVHRRGSDHAAGTAVLAPGSVVAPVDIAVLASCGLSDVRVARSPVVRVLSTGNELVPAGRPVEPHQVRLSNGPALVAMLAASGFDDAAHAHLPDDPDILRRDIGTQLEEADVLILSGGVSMGKADFVPSVLADLGVEVVFHKIAQRPGKPMWFGKTPDGEIVFALPGNPVSSMVCCRQYVLPALFSAAGRPLPPPQFAALTEAVEFRPKLTCFLPVRTRSRDDGTLIATPVPTNTSGDFTALSGTDGYVELDASKEQFPEGTVLPFHGWHSA